MKKYLLKTLLYTYSVILLPYCFAGGLGESYSDEKGTIIPYDRLIIPGLKIGRFYLDMTKQEVIDRLGRPDAVFYGNNKYENSNPPLTCYMKYEKEGLSVFISNGNVNRITVLNNNQRYRLDNGIHVGSTKQNITSLLGEASSNNKYGSIEFINFEHLGLHFEIDTKDKDRYELEILKCNSNNLIQYGLDAASALNRRIVFIVIEESTRNKIVSLFGEPLDYIWQGKTYNTFNLPPAYIIHYPFGLDFLMNDENIQEMRFTEDWYQTEDGLCVGLSIDQTLGILGQPTNVIMGRKTSFKPGVFYIDLDGVEGRCYYERADIGLRLWFENEKISHLDILNMNLLPDRKQIE